MVTNLSYLFVLFIFMTYLLVNFFYICNGTGVYLPSHRMESVYEDEGGNRSSKRNLFTLLLRVQSSTHQEK